MKLCIRSDISGLNGSGRARRPYCVPRKKKRKTFLKYAQQIDQGGYWISTWTRMGFSPFFCFSSRSVALCCETAAPALGHEASRMVSSFSLFGRNKTPASFVHHYLFMTNIKLSSAVSKYVFSCRLKYKKACRCRMCRYVTEPLVLLKCFLSFRSHFPQW